MHIFVRDPRGKTILVDVEPTDMILDLHLKLQAQTGIPNLDQQVVFAGRVLDLWLTLQECRIKKNSTVKMFGRLKG
jgi:hypothetical protein